MPRKKKWLEGHKTLTVRCTRELADKIEEARALLIVDACDAGERCMDGGEFARLGIRMLCQSLRRGTLSPGSLKPLMHGEAAVREVRRL